MSMEDLDVVRSIENDVEDLSVLDDASGGSCCCCCCCCACIGCEIDQK